MILYCKGITACHTEVEPPAIIYSAVVPWRRTAVIRDRRHVGIRLQQKFSDPSKNRLPCWVGLPVFQLSHYKCLQEQMVKTGQME